MVDGNARATLPIVRCGAIARDVLSHAGETRVIALFERCFYLACPSGIVCIGTPGIGAGPINVEIALPDGLAWAALDVMLDAEGQTDGTTCRIGDGFALAVETGETWHPPPMPPFDVARVTASLLRLRSLVPGLLPQEGLARLIFGDPSNANALPTMARAAKGPISDLVRGLPSSLEADTWTAGALRAATLLVGLGPGFTPSGDDLLGGLMLALTAAGRVTLRDALWHALGPELDDLTVPASAMHLSAAADGMASESVHHLLNTVLLDGPDLGARLDAVARIGHTSGWDSLAGLVLGLEAAAASS
jgi:Protein of unknown function (DUF2877)